MENFLLLLFLFLGFTTQAALNSGNSKLVPNYEKGFPREINQTGSYRIAIDYITDSSSSPSTSNNFLILVDTLLNEKPFINYGKSISSSIQPSSAGSLFMHISLDFPLPLPPAEVVIQVRLVDEVSYSEMNSKRAITEAIYLAQYPVVVKPFPYADPSNCTETLGTIKTVGIGRQTLFFQEKILTPKNVASGNFGLIATLPIQGQSYAQPLVIPNVPFGNNQFRTLVIAATMHNTVHAFDVENNYKQVWMRTFENACPFPDLSLGIEYCFGNYTDILGEVGILSTPVVDPINFILYFISRTCTPIIYGNNTNYQHWIHAVNVRDGTDYLPGQLIKASTRGVNFDSHVANQRAALLFLNGYVYVPFSSFCDSGKYVGWIMVFNGKTLNLELAWISSTSLGGIWQSGAPFTVDSDGYIYVATSNGYFNDTLGDYANSFIKFGPCYSKQTGEFLSLNILDWYTAWNQEELNEDDLDLGSTALIPVPGTELMVAGDKEGYVFVLNKTHLGHYSKNDSDVHQRFRVVPPPISNMSYWIKNIHAVLAWNSTVFGPVFYVMGEIDYFKMFILNQTSGYFPTEPSVQSPWRAPWNSMPGGIMSLSTNSDNEDAILWINIPITGDANLGTVTGELHAMNPNNITEEFWRSEKNPKDSYGNISKFSPVTVYGGCVYVPTFSNQIAVYGLLSYQEEISDTQSNNGEAQMLFLLSLVAAAAVFASVLMFLVLTKTSQKEQH